MRAIALIAACALLVGCGSFKTGVVTVNVPVPVVCEQSEPVRPVMPTEALQVSSTPDGFLDGFVAAATAEIERREGYETELVAALRACIRPLDVSVLQDADQGDVKSFLDRLLRRPKPES